MRLSDQEYNLIIMHLEHMVRENKGWRRFFKRWPINHEPLRSDAKYVMKVLKDNRRGYDAHRLAVMKAGTK